MMKSNCVVIATLLALLYPSTTLAARWESGVEVGKITMADGGFNIVPKSGSNRGCSTYKVHPNKGGQSQASTQSDLVRALTAVATKQDVNLLVSGGCYVQSVKLDVAQ